MPDMTEKLDRFTAKILAEASEESKRAMDQAQQKRAAALRRAEDQVLREAYQYIHREVARINRLQRRRAEGEGRKGQFPVRTDLLLRVKNTEAQKKLSAPERLLNLQSAFRGTEAASGVETVLLLDDIYTTGATMEACTRALLAAGVRQVYGLCVCAGADV